MKLSYYQHKEIDINRWDKCIERSVNGTFMANSWFLNTICEDWDAIIDEKYTCVMPLPIIKKRKRKLISQPKLAKHLGIFSTSVIDDNMIESVFNEIPQAYQYVDIQCNKYNKIQTLPGYTIEKGFAYDLDLIINYNKIVSSYSTKGHDNIKIAQTHNLNIVFGMLAKDLINFYSENNSFCSETLSETDLQALQLIISYAIRNTMGEVVGAYDTNNKLCAIAFFVGSHQKITLLFYAQNKTALSNRALYLMIDSFMKKHAEKNIVLSFTGDVSGIDFCDLGGKKSEYFKLSYNRLPFYTKLFLNIP